ncbi:glycosyltransferase family 2 protein [Oscillochloris sp. ZM17-4]|uniref:glycosyltransferase family 2 protein n=1 Tax=Oscillochloris sp. ZM17-4 TaxID=2866714 RepID=UPI001C73BFF3|nr:glycosyltransferase family 2 protein [Oscillochloris sp. ZM17-4]
MYRGQRISVVIPCFNEEHGLRHVLEGMPSYIDEVVVVDNNSTDETARVAQELGARVIFEARKGYGNAYQAGLPVATGDIIATVDGDGTYPSTSIAPIIDDLLDRGLDFVSASRFPLRDARAMRRRNVLGNKVLTYTFRALYLRWVADSQSGMWVFRRSCLSQIRPTQPGMAFSEEIKIEALHARGLRFGEHHVDYYERIGETKLYTWRDGFINLGYLFRRRLGRLPALAPVAEPVASDT